jgi:hypothetical protein
MQVGVRRSNANDLSKIELHVFLRRRQRASASLSYEFDDGESTAYADGQRSRFVVRAAVKGARLHLRFSCVDTRFQSASVAVVCYDRFDCVQVAGASDSDSKQYTVTERTWSFVGVPSKVWVSRPFRV